MPEAVARSTKLTAPANARIDSDWVYLSTQTLSACPETFRSSPMHFCGDSILHLVSVRFNIKREASVCFRIRKRCPTTIHQDTESFVRHIRTMQHFSSLHLQIVAERNYERWGWKKSGAANGSVRKEIDRLRQPHQPLA